MLDALITTALNGSAQVDALAVLTAAEAGAHRDLPMSPVAFGVVFFGVLAVALWVVTMLKIDR